MDKKEFYYPSLEKLKTEEIDTIKLSDFKNYNELIGELENLNYRNKYGLLKLENDNEIFNLMLTTRYGYCYGGPIIKEKNLIVISEDSIKKNEEIFGIDSLPTILKKDLNNNGKINRYAESSEKLRISIALKNPENYHQMESYLKNLIGEFNELNETKKYELNIQIDRDFHFWRNLKKNLPE